MIFLYIALLLAYIPYLLGLINLAIQKFRKEKNND